MTQLFLDDLYVGQKFVSESYALSEEKIIQYAQFRGSRLGLYQLHNR